VDNSISNFAFQSLAEKTSRPNFSVHAKNLPINASRTRLGKVQGQGFKSLLTEEDFSAKAMSLEEISIASLHLLRQNC